MTMKYDTLSGADVIIITLLKDPPGRRSDRLARSSKDGIKVHIERKRNNLPKRYNLQCSFCPKTYKDNGSVNRHIYKTMRTHKRKYTNY